MSDMEVEEVIPGSTGSSKQQLKQPSVSPSPVAVVAVQEVDETLNESLQPEDNSISYEIEKIIDSKKDENGKVLYKARWIAHTWVPEDCLASFQHLVKEYWTDVENNKETVDKDATKLSSGGTVGDNASSENLDEPATTSHAGRENTAFLLATDTAYNDESTTNDVSDRTLSASRGDSIMYCSQCNQRFFLKSNLEVHVLFCEGGKKTVASATITETAATTVLESGRSTAAKSVVSEEVVISEAYTFEYVPVDSKSSQDCISCSQRLPSGGVVEPALTDLTQLTFNSCKKIISNKVEVHTCNECNREFLFKYPAAKTESQAKKAKITVKPYKCSICSRAFVLENEMLEHEVKHSNTPTRYACAKCNEKFIARDLLEKHYDSTENDCAPRKCDICQRTFIHMNHLKRHMSIHLGIKPFGCTICGHEFNQKSDLYRHEKLHTVNGKLTCSKCAQDFTSIEKLRVHVKVHVSKDGDAKPCFFCDRCGKTFGRKSHLKRHVSVHNGSKPHTCEQCGKSFNQRTDLKRHELSHVRREMKAKGNMSDERIIFNGSDFMCTICNKTFPTRSASIQHSLTHQKIINTGVMY